MSTPCYLNGIESTIIINNQMISNASNCQNRIGKSNLHEEISDTFEIIQIQILMLPSTNPETLWSSFRMHISGGAHMGSKPFVADG